MAPPSDWQFTPDHTDLDEAGVLGSGEQTLVDWACTVALTTPGQLPEDLAFGAGLGDQLGDPMADPRELGERLRGQLLADERVADVATDATTEAGALTLPVRLDAAAEPYRLAGLLTPELIETIIADEEGDE